MSYRFAFLMIDEMAWWHREGMPSMVGSSLSWRIVVAWVGVEASSCWGSESGGFVCVGYVGGGFFLELSVGGVAEFCEAF